MSGNNRHLNVYGAAEHNLREINVSIPRNSLTVITGLSGSGKSSLAFDTIYAEGQRRYVESLSAYARQFLDRIPKPEVEHIEGLSPAISIDQKTVGRNPRSTVGTTTEINDFLRVLYATVGRAHCPVCGKMLVQQSADDIVDQILQLPNRTRILILAPVIRGRKGEYQALFRQMLKQGFIRAKIDGVVEELDPQKRLKKAYKHDISIVVDRLIVRKSEIRPRLQEAVKTALRLASGLVIVETIPDSEGKFPAGVTWKGERTFSEELGCPEHGPQIIEVAPRTFSFNSPYGACPTCNGLGVVPVVDPARLVPNPSLSLEEGAVLPWGDYFRRKRRQHIPSREEAIIQAVVEQASIPTDKPWEELSQKHRDILLHGSGRKKFPVNRSGHERLLKWKGLVPILTEQLESGDEDIIATIEPYLDKAACPDCQGARLRPESLAVSLGDKNIAEVSALHLGETLEHFKKLKLTKREQTIAFEPLREVTERLQFLINVGLDYLTLDRSIRTLSGGESQRIRLAGCLGSQMTGVLYVLDEPSIGLHQRDNEKLIGTLRSIRDLGNTVIVVEHDEATIRAADHVVDLGPGAGRHGGLLVAEGDPKSLLDVPESLTGRYLRGEQAIERPEKRRESGDRKLRIEGCSLHNLKEVDLELPLGLLIGVTGVSGSGKSSLILETLLPVLMNHCFRGSMRHPGPHKRIEGLEHLDKVIDVDQSPIGRTPRSNPATYTKVFDLIRKLFAEMPEAKRRGYKPGRFSFNVKGGRCEECRGDGMQRVQMYFLPDAYVLCDVCKGKRYNEETLAVKYHDKSISEVLEMTVEEACEFFAPVPLISRKIETLNAVGLGYITLGQSAPSLSGGEAQRIKLARELSKINTGRTLYILDEPTTGLHFADVHNLLIALNKLVDTGSTVIVIEHNLDVIKSCDWVIDLGPEGGEGGGKILAEGPPEKVARKRKSHTGRFLKEVL